MPVEIHRCSKCGARIGSREAKLCVACAFTQALEAESPLEPPSPLRIRYFGDYEILEEIGRGGMGTVFRASQSSLRREVALKVITHGPFAAPENLRRFRAEAKLAASLDHPHIVPIYEVGEHEGQPYFSMGLVRGSTLRERIENGPLAPRDAARLIARIASAVHYAHQRAILHRDLKPANILLDETGEPHLTDFGLARLLNTDSTLTRTDAVLGTPSYMAPEQARGDARNLTIAADVYGLGALLYHCVTGTPPFAGGTSMETVRQVLEREPRRPSGLNPAIDRDLETICLKCLEKDPPKRYSSAAAVAEDLENWLAHKPIAARPSGVLDRTKKVIRRHPLVSALSLALLLSFLGGSMAVLAQWRRAEGEKAAALRARDTAQQEQQRVGHLLDELNLKNADDLLASQKTAEALATFARVLRRTGTNRIAAARILSLFTHRNFIFPNREAFKHDSAVLACFPSPDEKWLLTVTEDQSVQLWETSTGQREGVWRTGQQACAPRWAPSAEYFSINFRGTPYDIYNVETKARVATIPAPADWCGLELLDGLAVTWAPQHSRIQLWRWPEPVLRATAELAGPVRGCSASADFNDVVVLTTKVLEKFNLTDLKLIRRLTIPDEDIAGRGPDGSLVTIARERGQMVLRDGDSLERLRIMPPSKTPMDHALFCRNGLAFLALPLGRGGQLYDRLTLGPLTEPLLNVFGREAIAPFREHEAILRTEHSPWLHFCDLRPSAAASPVFRHADQVTFAVFDQSGRRLLTTSLDKTARVWDPENGRLLTPPLIHESGVKFGAFSPNGEKLLTVTDDHFAHFWDIKTGKPFRAPINCGDHVDSGEFNSDGSRAIVGSRKGVIQIIDCRDPAAEIMTLTNAPILCARFSPDGKFTAFSTWSAAGPQRIALWSLEPRQEIFSIPTLGLAHSLAFSPDGLLLAAATDEGAVGVWDASTGKEVTGWLGRDQLRLTVVDFSPDSKWIVTAGRNGTAAVRNARNGTLRYNLLPCGGDVWSAQFSRSGHRILTITADGVLRLWDAASGLPLSEELPGHRIGARPWVPLPNKCLFTPDDSRVVAPAADNKAEILCFPDPKGPVPPWLADLAEAMAGRRFTKEGLVEQLRWKDLQQMRERLKAAAEMDGWTQWAHWFFADRGTRPIAPGIPFSTPEFFQSLARDGTLESLSLAARIEPSNPDVLNGLAARIEQDQAPIPASAALVRELRTRAAELGHHVNNASPRRQ